jgi:hypothetical protein
MAQFEADFARRLAVIEEKQKEYLDMVNLYNYDNTLI